MNGIEYSALANVIGQRWQQTVSTESKKPALNSVHNAKQQTAVQNSINSVYGQNEPHENVFVGEQSTAISRPTTTLANRLQSMVEPPEYLLPTLIYKNCAANVSTPVRRAGGGEKSGGVRQDYTDDFILVSEFSEIEGPRPLLTIPTDGATGFNKNEYSLHLMCVDFHSHLSSSSPSPSPSPGTTVGGNASQSADATLNDSLSNALPTKFGLTKDTSIINYWDLNARMVCACVQHFNLYDLEARGLDFTV